jgi:hypothetical protein
MNFQGNHPKFFIWIKRPNSVTLYNKKASASIAIVIINHVALRGFETALSFVDFHRHMNEST